MNVSFSEHPVIHIIPQISPQKKEMEKVSVEIYIKDHYDSMKAKFAENGKSYSDQLDEQMAIDLHLRREYRTKYLKH